MVQKFQCTIRPVGTTSPPSGPARRLEHDHTQGGYVVQAVSDEQQWGYQESRDSDFIFAHGQPVVV